MTQARLVTTPPEGHGITGRMLDRLYHELTSGKNMGENMLVVGIVTPVSTSQRRTAKGVKRFVGFEFLRLEPITDMSVAEEVRFALVSAYERRTSGSKQLPLEFDGAPELEKRREIFAALDEWRGDQEPEVTPSELTEMWRDYIQPVEGAAVPALVHAPTQNILEFAYHINAITRPKLLGMEALPDETGGPQAVRPVPEALFMDGNEGAGEDAGDGEQGEASDAGEVGVKCQVCGKKFEALYDGMCAEDAKNAGIPVPSDDKSIEDAAAEATEKRGSKTKAADKGLRAV